MILYQSSDWFSAIFRWYGTVWGEIWDKVAFLFLYNLAMYLVTNYYEFQLGDAGHTILGGTMSFLLVFRANQSYGRYMAGRQATLGFFSDLRDFMLVMGLHVEGGKGARLSLV